MGVRARAGLRAPRPAARRCRSGAVAGCAGSGSRRRDRSRWPRSLAAGAGVVVALDNAAGMLRRGGSMRSVLADACALPFTTDSFDLVVAAISLGHVSDPVRALRETRRVGGALLVSAFEAGWTHPAKAAVDQALVPFGFRPPPWYVVLKRNIEPQVDDPDHLGALATAAD